MINEEDKNVKSQKKWAIGDIRNGYPVLPLEERKTILLLSDDARMHSGVGTMSREIVLGTCHYFNWVQIAGAIKNPDIGKIVELSQSTVDATGVPDAHFKLYPVNGYGNPNVLRMVLANEPQVNGLLHFTDPRFWGWLYQMENEIRQSIPIMYWALWDNLPYPKWNRDFYRSCDLIMSISKQSKNIHDVVLKGYAKKENIEVTYVPHGINPNVFFPIENKENDVEYSNFKNTVLNREEYDFIILYNNRNLGRKRTADIMTAFQSFSEKVGNKKKPLLLMRTDISDDGGTNLHAVYRDLMPEINVKFIPSKISPSQMNYLYNMSDLTINVSSAEGFGLASAESIMAGTPILVNCTGGLQDQLRMVNDDHSPVEFTEDFPSNSCGVHRIHGPWAFVVWPQQNLIGSPPTPYIYDDRASINDITEKMYEAFSLSKKNMNDRAVKGRKWILNNLSSPIMCEKMTKDISKCVYSFKGRKHFDIFKIESNEKDDNTLAGIWDETIKKWL